jgi:hypothetical protein
MGICMMQHVQDRQTLRRHSITAGAEEGGIFISTGHGKPLLQVFAIVSIYSIQQREISYVKNTGV